MDRPIEPHILRKRRDKRLLQGGILLAGLAGLFLLASAWISPSVARRDIQTAFVAAGSIDGSISASGTVVPAFEQAISSPGESRLLSVRKRPGEHVSAGDVLLDLDRSELALSLERTEKELSLKANRQQQLRLDIDRALEDLKGQLAVKVLRLEFLRSKSVQSDKMLELGAISKDQMEQTKLEERIAGIEREKLEQSIQNTGESLDNQLDGITTEVGTLHKERTDIRRQLELLACKAGRDGVVTWVKEEIGSSIHRGEIIARIADLSSYLVEATVSDVHAARLTVGMPATIRANDLAIAGKIQTVYPAIENGIAKLALTIDGASNASLRPNLRVDVSLITSRRDSALTLKKGPFVNGAGERAVFRISGGVAIRVPVKLGVMNFTDVEILDGLSAGDEVIISDMDDYRHLSQIKIH